MSFNSTPDTTNIRLGTCRISYRGVDLGYTMGGVEVEVETTTHETKVDQFGDIVANEFIEGRTIMVRAPMAEVTLNNMVDIMPGASFVGDGVKATGTLTVATEPVADETITVNGEVITFKASGAVEQNSEVNLTGVQASTAQNIATLINKRLKTAFGRLTATVVGAVVTITYNIPGIAGNAVTLVDGTTGDVTVSGANLTGGVDPTSQYVEVKTGVGISLLDIAGELVLHPIALADSDLSEDLVIPLAATPGAMSFAYKFDEERVFNAEFKGYPDASGVLFKYGDKTAV